MEIEKIDTTEYETQGTSAIDVATQSVEQTEVENTEEIGQ